MPTDTHGVDLMEGEKILNGPPELNVPTQPSTTLEEIERSEKAFNEAMFEAKKATDNAMKILNELRGKR